MNVLERLKQKSQAPEFSFYGLKRGTIGVLSAPGSTGKGFLVLQSLMTLASKNLGGHPFLKTPNKKVGYLSLEDDDSVINRRLQSFVTATVVNEDNLYVINDNFEIKTGFGDDYIVYDPRKPKKDSTIDENRKRLKEFCTDKELVVIDTLSKFNAGDENSNADMAQLLVQLERIAQATQCSILIVHHSSKAATLNGQSDNQASARGASALIDNARYHMTMQTMTKKEAEKLKVNDHKMYLQVNVPKANYVAPQPALWYERDSFGVIHYLKDGVKVRGGKNGEY